MNSIDMNAFKDQIETFVAKYPVIDGPLSQAAEKTKLEKGYIALIVAAIPILIIFAIGEGDFLIDLISYIYPVYASIKSIESGSKEDDTLWLTYWIIFSFFKIVEDIGDFVISYIPFYYLGKMAFLVYSFHPSTRGAQVVYNTVIKAFVVPALGLDKKQD